MLGADATGAFDRVFVGWGRCPSFTEHDAVTGETLLDVQFSPWHSEEIVDALDNYRAYRMDWVAEPWWDPVMALRLGEEEEAEGARLLDVYLSWNGATEVREWVVRGLVNDSGVDARNEAPVLARGKRSGFETRLNATLKNDSGLKYLWAEALDAQGQIIRKTEVVEFEAVVAAGGNMTMGGLPMADVADFEQMLEETLAAGHHELSTLWRWILIGGGVFLGLCLVSAAVRFVTRRYEMYDQLDAEDFDLDGESDVDEEEVPLGVDFLPEGEITEPWQDFTMIAPKKGAGRRDSGDS